MSAIIDFEGFQLSRGDFVIKELAFFSTNDCPSWGVWYFEPPKPFDDLTFNLRKQCVWVTTNIHRMNWQEGSLPYSNVKKIIFLLFEMFTHVYVKGLQKVKFLEMVTGYKCINLEDFSCPKVEELFPSYSFCSVHEPNFKHCAVAKTTAYASFLKKYLN